jgi:hypothetical protein
MRALAEKILHRVFNNRCSERCGSLVFACADRRIYVVRESSAGIEAMLTRHAADFVGLYGGNPKVDRAVLRDQGIRSPIMPSVEQVISDLREHFKLNGIEVPAHG